MKPILTPSGRDRAKIKAYNDRRIVSTIGTCSVCGKDGVKIWMQGGRRCVPCHTSWRRVQKGLPAVADSPLESDTSNFWKRTNKTESNNDCWTWNGMFMQDGYARMYSRYFGTDKMRAHRFAFFLKHGRLPHPNGLHYCDNPKCVNPNHIFEGTHADNIHDCISKGRFRPGICLGEKNHKSKLNPDKVKQIRELYRSGIGLADLGRNFGVTPQSISGVVNRKNWNHVP